VCRYGAVNWNREGMCQRRAGRRKKVVREDIIIDEELSGGGLV
jgi:hypothetical protein